MQREEKILVCLSGSPTNARVVRAAAKIAEAFHGTLTALLLSLQIMLPSLTAALRKIFASQSSSEHRSERFTEMMPRQS